MAPPKSLFADADKFVLNAIELAVGQTFNGSQAAAGGLAKHCKKLGVSSKKANRACKMARAVNTARNMEKHFTSMGEVSWIKTFEASLGDIVSEFQKVLPPVPPPVLEGDLDDVSGTASSPNSILVHYDALEIGTIPIGGVDSSLGRPSHPVSHVEANTNDYVFCLGSEDFDEKPVFRTSLFETDDYDMKVLDRILNDHVETSPVAYLGGHGCFSSQVQSTIERGAQCHTVYVFNEDEWEEVQNKQLGHFQALMEKNNERMGDKLLAQFESKLDLMNARHADDMDKMKMLHQLEVDALKVQIADLSAPRCATKKVKV